MAQATLSLVAPDFLTLTAGIAVYFLGVIVTQKAAILRNYNIPEPVSGGFLAALALWVFQVGVFHRYRQCDCDQGVSHTLR